MTEATAFTVALAAGFVSAAALWMCLLQWRYMEAKRRIDLFEQRFEVYIEFWQEAYAIIQIGPPDEERRYQLMILLQKARFLFSEDIYLYLQQFVEKADELARTKFVGQEADADEQKRSSKARMDNLLWFDQQSEEIARRFRPYLGAETRRKRPAPTLIKPKAATPEPAAEPPAEPALLGSRRAE